MKSDIKFTNDTDFAYGVGLIRALETRMISKSTFENYSDMALENILKAVSDYGYSDDLEESIENDKKNNYKLLDNLVGRKERYKNLIDIFSLKEDIFNLKNFLKNSISPHQISYSPKFSFLGNLSEKDISNMIEKNRFTVLDEVNGDTVGKYLLRAKQEKSPAIIEHLLDSLYFALVIKKVEESGVDFLIFYFREYIDFLNLENIIRFKVLDKDFSYYSNFFFNGGIYTLSDISQIYNKKVEDILSSFKSRDFYMIFKEGWDNWEKNKNWNIFEKGREGYFINIMKLTKVLSFGVEPLFGYLFGKEIEYKNLHIVVNSKRAKIDSKKIKERIKDTYV